jgi:hypothetical protein
MRVERDLMKKISMVGGSAKVISISIILVVSLFVATIGATSEQVPDSISISYVFPAPVISKIALEKEWYDQLLIQGAP